ncbi:probable ribose-5-phosphate isomerase 2 [Dioscorea cayenensis subsp. rotundata]|uniref:ribose-5-phosphate isomerase n=1 Tax=Dioscorea cayennensis subsp. rotundata TaxID=55577 RepID=A0AB40CZT9_DIOCR|nr:probable ribose-5-phosphate isomerase 2 [Dioscorea cayenensis subsp. rotundata]
MRGVSIIPIIPQTLDMPTPFPHLLSPSPPSAVAPAAVVLSQDEQKRVAAYRAVDFVQSGMVLGLGTGSTAVHALDRIADLLRRGVLHDIVGIPTSKQTESIARALKIPLSDLDAHPVIDLSIDGADEVDPFLNLVKGRGGSLLREKMIEGATKKFIVIVDESKMVGRLGGSGLAVPVEIVPFGWSYTLSKLKALFELERGFNAKLRTRVEEDGKEVPFVTDNGNYIIDLYFENGIERDLGMLSDSLLRIVGVAEHGMFLGMATSVIVANKDGEITVINK